jgi:hypothetical protein
MSSVVVAFLVPVVLAALGAAVRPHARRVGADRVVEYGAGFRGFATLSAVLAGLAALVSLFLSAEDRPWILGIAGILAVPTAFLLPHAYLTRFCFGENGITALSPWRKPLVISWSQIANVRYSTGERSYVVVAQCGAELNLHAYMSGVPELVAEMQRREVRGALLAQATAGSAGGT